MRTGIRSEITYGNSVQSPEKPKGNNLKSFDRILWSVAPQKTELVLKSGGILEVTCDVPLFRIKRFALNEMFQRNTSKFAVFYV